MVLRGALLTSVTMLACVSSAAADATERVENGGFETGPTFMTAPPWVFTSANPCNAMCGGLAPASGSRYATTWNFDFDQGPPQSIDNPVGHFEQSLVVPEAPAKLSFGYRIVNSPGAPDVGMKLTVSLDGTVLTDIFDETSTIFQDVTLPIPAGLIKTDAQTLRFEAFCTNQSNITADCDAMDIDDVSLVTGPPPDAPTITGTDPGSPADQTSPRVKGTVGSGGATGVKIYRNASCAGLADATGTVAEFTGAGIAVSVPDNSTTALSASAANLAGDSTCSNSLTYVELGGGSPGDGSPGGGSPGGGSPGGGPPGDGSPGGGPPSGGSPPSSPASGITGLRSKFLVAASGSLLLGKATNSPTSSTTQKLTATIPSSSARRRTTLVIGSGRTTIPAGTTRDLTLKLNRKGKRLLRQTRRLRAQLTIVATGPTGLRDTLRKAVRLTAKRARR
jgi:hypothetical protein